MEKHFVASNPQFPKGFIATVLGYRSSVTGVTSYTRELVGYLLDADKQHG
jgi:hypothetical protein